MNAFNAEASLNGWLAETLAAYLLPAWLPTLPPIVYDWREIELTLPCFSLTHIPVRAQPRYQGRHVGGSQKGLRAAAMLEVSCWVARTSPSYSAQLRTMRDFVLTAVAATSAVPIKDYAANPAAPPVTAYRVFLGQVSGAPIALDENRNALQAGIVIANPDVLRARLLIDYTYIHRA
jgi:hypothetical protein